MFEFKASQIPRNEAYLGYAAVTRDEAQRRNRTFYEAINIQRSMGGKTEVVAIKEDHRRSGSRERNPTKWPHPYHATPWDLKRRSRLTRFELSPALFGRRALSHIGMGAFVGFRASTRPTMERLNPGQEQINIKPSGTAFARSGRTCKEKRKNHGTENDRQ